MFDLLKKEGGDLKLNEICPLTLNGVKLQTSIKIDFMPTNSCEGIQNNTNY